MTDWLSVMERGLKAVRFGIFQASDNLAMLLEGLCCAPEPVLHEDGCPCAYYGGCANVGGCEGKCGCDKHGYDNLLNRLTPEDSAASPQVAVVAPSPKQGSDSGPAEIDAFPRVPAGPHPQEVIEDVLAHHQWVMHVNRIECWADSAGTSSCGWFRSSDEWREHVAELIAWKLFGEPA